MNPVNGVEMTTVLLYSTKEASRQDINLILSANKTIEETGILDGMTLTATECLNQAGLKQVAIAQAQAQTSDSGILVFEEGLDLREPTGQEMFAP